MLIYKKRLSDAHGLDGVWRKYWFHFGFNFELCRPWYWNIYYDGYMHNMGLGFGYFYWYWFVDARDYSEDQRLPIGEQPTNRADAPPIQKP